MVFVGENGPYNSMVKNWPRTVEIYLHSFEIWGNLLAEERKSLTDSDSLQGILKAELGTLQKSVNEIAKQVIAALEIVIEMESPYPPEYQEVVYQAFRYSLGSGFDQLLSEKALDKIIQRLTDNGTL